MTTFVTGYSPDGWERYGRRCAATWERFLPQGSRVIAYCHPSMRDAIPVRWQRRSITEISGLLTFVDRHGGDPVARGRKPRPNDRWKPSEVEANYNFRFDAVKFAYMSFQMADAALRLPYGSLMAWIDGDVVMRAPVPETVIADTLRVSQVPRIDADVAYLGRAPKHSEIGWLSFRTTGACRDMLSDLMRLYESDELFDLKEWHSAYVFDHARAIHERRGLIARDMTPGGRGHVWMRSELARFSEHLKGDRKDNS